MGRRCICRALSLRALSESVGTQFSLWASANLWVLSDRVWSISESIGSHFLRVIRMIGIPFLSYSVPTRQGRIQGGWAREPIPRPERKNKTKRNSKNTKDKKVNRPRRKNNGPNPQTFGFLIGSTLSHRGVCLSPWAKSWQ